MTAGEKVTQKELYQVLTDMRKEREEGHRMLLQNLSLLGQSVNVIGHKVDTLHRWAFADNGTKGIDTRVKYLEDKELIRETQKVTIFGILKIGRKSLLWLIPGATALGGWLIAHLKL